MKTSLALSTRRGMAQTFSALRYPNYRLWFGGQLVSLIGTWMQSTAQAYLVYDLTKSPAYLGYVGFAAGVPTWLFTLYGGVIADRIPRRKMLIITQTSMMLLAFILSGLVFTNIIQPWMIIILAFALGTANAFDAPARVSFVAELVDRKDLTNGIALNATMFNSATVVGPAIAGLAYAALGPAWCFMINGLSFIAVIFALLLMHLPQFNQRASRRSVLAEIREGMQYTRNNHIILSVIAGIGLLSLFGLSLMTLLPAWSTTVLNGDAKTYGLLLSGRGIGALIGGLMIAWLGRYNVRGKLLTIGNLTMPLLLAGFALSYRLPLSMVFIILTGMSFMIQVNISNAIVQLQVTDVLRGRVMSIYSLVFFGSMPLGALFAGQMADRVGEQYTLILCAAILLVFAGVSYYKMPYLRQQA
jgi:MFS family permease